MKNLIKTLTIVSTLALSSGAVLADENNNRERYAHEKQERYNNDLGTSYEQEKVKTDQLEQRKSVKADHEKQSNYNE